MKIKPQIECRFYKLYCTCNKCVNFYCNNITLLHDYWVKKRYMGKLRIWKQIQYLYNKME